jgi:hypothetical protein
MYRDLALSEVCMRPFELTMGENEASEAMGARLEKRGIIGRRAKKRVYEPLECDDGVE